MDRLQALRVFKRVAELHGFSAAARDLELSNAAVSKNVNELEAYLGARLLTRTTRRVSLTEAGEIYYDYCVRVLRELEDADAAVMHMNQAPRGLLRVSAPMSLGLVKLSPRIPRFLSRYPEVKLELDLDDNVVDLIDKGYDIAIRGRSALPDSSLVSRRLGPVRRVLCATPTYLYRHGVPRRPRDLGQHRCLVFTLSPSPDVWEFQRGETAESVRVDGPYRSNNSLSILDAALADLGIARLPKNYVEHLLQEGRLVSVLDDWQVEQQSLFAIYPSARHVSPKLRVFIDFLVDEFAAE